MLVFPRIHRMFAEDGKCLNIALDHGIFREPSFLAGIEDIAQSIGRIVKAGPDALQLAPGPARILQGIPGPRKPALVMRADTTNIYLSPESGQIFSILIAGAVEQAVTLDAAAIAVNLLVAPGAESVHRDCIENVMLARRECERFGMPLMVEPLVFRRSPDHGRMDSTDDTQAIATLVRQAVELGADLIKTDPGAHAAEFGRIVEAASGKPVLVRGGSKKSASVLFELAAEWLQQGARGCVFGRNIVQQPSPTGMVAALMAILHAQASAAEAEEILSRSNPV